MIPKQLASLFLILVQLPSDLVDEVRGGSQKAALEAIKKLDQAGERDKLLPIIEERWKNSPAAGVESDGTFDEEVPLILFKMKDARADAIILRHFMSRGIAFDAEKAMIELDLDRYAKIRVSAVEKAPKNRKAYYIGQFDIISTKTDKYDALLRKFAKWSDPIGHTARKLLKDSIAARRGNGGL